MSMDAAVEKLEEARARLEAAGDCCPNLDHLLAVVSKGQQAEALIPANAMTLSGGGFAIPCPDARLPKTVQLFKGLWAFLQAGSLGFSSIGYFTFSPALVDLLGTALGPYGSLQPLPGGTKAYHFIEPAQVDTIAERGLLGSLSILQLLAASLLQVHFARSDSMLSVAMDRLACTMRALWGPACLSAASQRAQRQLLDRRQWVPEFPPADAPRQGSQGSQGQAPRPCQLSEAAQLLQEHLQEHCGLGSADAALGAVWEICLTLRVAAGTRMQEPSKQQAQQVLCNAQALLDRCTSAAATSEHIITLVKVAGLAIAGSQWCGSDQGRRQMLVGYLEEVLSRAEAEKCWYSAGYAALTLADLCAQLSAGLGSRGPVRLRGAGSASIGEVEALRRRSCEAASAVAGYKPRLKRWLPGGLQQVYLGWVANAAQLEAAPMTPAQVAAPSAGPTNPLDAAAASFPVCSHCGLASLHLRKCAACKEVAYCGKACQAADWKSHKPRCKELAAQRSRGAAA